MTQPDIICIAGPTGAGKTAAALRLSRHADVTVINADSRQVYAAFPIITAQPSPEERAACPHVLYGGLGIEQPSSAGWWCAAAGEALRCCAAQNRLPLLVGGTGLYMRTLLDGMVDIPPVPDAVRERLERELDEQGGEILHERLRIIDPAYAAKVHPRNRQRLVRALAVHEVTGRSFSWWHAQTPEPPYPRVLRLGLSLPLNARSGDELTPRLVRRVEAMLDAGALNEARAALELCANPEAPGWSGIGCAELHAHLAGALSLDEAVALWIKNTRAYARRQMTWFRADKRIRWFHPGEEDRLAALVLAHCSAEDGL